MDGHSQGQKRARLSGHQLTRAQIDSLRVFCRIRQPSEMRVFGNPDLIVFVPVDVPGPTAD